MPGPRRRISDGLEVHAEGGARGPQSNRSGGQSRLQPAGGDAQSRGGGGGMGGYHENLTPHPWKLWITMKETDRQESPTLPETRSTSSSPAAPAAPRSCTLLSQRRGDGGLREGAERMGD